jgi:hypothetical protein
MRNAWKKNSRDRSCAKPSNVVTSRRSDWILILSDFTGASFHEETSQAMKETAVFDRLYAKKSAWVGAENLPKVFSEKMRSFSRREFPAFGTREEALTWLTTD